MLRPLSLGILSRTWALTGGQGALQLPRQEPHRVDVPFPVGSGPPGVAPPGRGGGRALTSRLVKIELPDGHRLFLRMEVVRVVSASEPQQLSCRDGGQLVSLARGSDPRGGPSTCRAEALQLPRWAWARAGAGTVPSCSALLLRDRSTPAGLASLTPTPRATGPRGASPLPAPPAYRGAHGP